VSLVIAVVAVIVVVASYLTWMAGRLDRLAVRVEAAASALDAQLARRAVVAYELSEAASLEPLRAAARRALDDRAESVDRGAVESSLSRELRATPAVAGVEEMAILSRKVMLARQFHNDAVRDLLALRRRRLVRLLHLYGRAAAPSYIEFDAYEPGA
jgi:hypothetical protein